MLAHSNRGYDGVGVYGGYLGGSSDIAPIARDDGLSIALWGGRCNTTTHYGVEAVSLGSNDIGGGVVFLQ